MHTHHLLYGVLTQYLSPGPCLDVVDWWSSSRPVVADAIARVPFARFVSVFCSAFEESDGDFRVCHEGYMASYYQMHGNHLGLPLCTAALA